MSDIPLTRFGFLSLVFLCLVLFLVGSVYFAFILFRMSHSKYKIERNEEVCYSNV